MVRRLAVLLLIVAVIGFAFWAGIRNAHERKAEMQKTQEKVLTLQKNSPEEGNSPAPGAELHGKPAPAFSLVDLSGKKVSLAQFKGHPVIVNFWATWCGPCQLEMPWFEQFNQKYKDKGLVILGLSQDEGTSTDVIAKSAKRLGVTYPILQPDESVAKLYGGVDYLPETFYVDAKGTVVEETAGAPTKDEIEANIKKIFEAGA